MMRASITLYGARAVARLDAWGAERRATCGRGGGRVFNIFMRGRAAVARLAHNQEVAGSNPARATTLASDGPFLSPEDGRLTRGGRCVSTGRRTSFIEILNPTCVDVVGERMCGRRIDTGARTPFFVSGPLGIARENLALTNCRQPGSDAVREESKRLPCVVALHPQRMEQARGKFSGIEYAQK